MTTTTIYPYGELPPRSMPPELEHLAELDGELLPIVPRQTPVTADLLRSRCPREHRPVFSRWLESARWRRLVGDVHDEARPTSPPRYLRLS